jgi:hypothetical protein
LQENYRRLGKRVEYLSTPTDGFLRAARESFAFSEPQWSTRYTIARTFPGDSQNNKPFHIMKECFMQAFAGWFAPRSVSECNAIR